MARFVKCIITVAINWKIADMKECFVYVSISYCGCNKSESEADGRKSRSFFFIYVEWNDEPMVKTDDNMKK